MMKILLTVPTQQNVYGIKVAPTYPPLGILYVAAMLENLGHQVEFVDMEIENMDGEGFINHVNKISPELIGFSCVTPTADFVFKISRLIKKQLPEITIVMGGIHASTDPDSSINHSGIDFLILKGMYTSLRSL